MTYGLIIDQHLIPDPGIIDLLPGQRLYLLQLATGIVIFNPALVTISPVGGLLVPGHHLAIQRIALLGHTFNDVVGLAVTGFLTQQLMIILGQQAWTDVLVGQVGAEKAVAGITHRNPPGTGQRRQI